jgi:hypothetical protein
MIEEHKGEITVVADGITEERLTAFIKTFNFRQQILLDAQGSDINYVFP